MDNPEKLKAEKAQACGHGRTSDDAVFGCSESRSSEVHSIGGLMKERAFKIIEDGGKDRAITIYTDGTVDGAPGSFIFNSLVGGAKISTRRPSSCIASQDSLFAGEGPLQ